MGAVYALHDAVKCLRKDSEGGENNFECWVPFVYFGAYMDGHDRVNMVAEQARSHAKPRVMGSRRVGPSRVKPPKVLAVWPQSRKRRVTCI